MKNLFFIFTILGFALISCRGEDQNLQQIDQVINLFYKDAAGKDLLNTKLKGSYSNIKFFDLNAATNLAPITSFSLRETKDTINYIDYAAGAVRLLMDSVSPENKTYRSDFVISLTKVIDSSNAIITQDTVNIEYSSTPDLFQISKLFYNRKLVFSKVSGQPNIITIIK